jgi:hypothetical protein
LVIVVAILMSHLPLSLAFWISRSSMDIFAQEVVSNKNQKTPNKWIGLFYAKEAIKTPTGMQFTVGGTDEFDGRGGFTWSPSGPPVIDSEGADVQHIGGPWYSWRENW